MEDSEADWTITWRQLAACLEVPPESSDASLLMPIVSIQKHSRKMETHANRWLVWLKRWISIVDNESAGREVAAQTIRATSPRYVPREWMLREAYEAAQIGMLEPVEELFELLKHPYVEHDDSESRYYECKRRVAIS
jgi:uncharacterized protein YdiU (UPF0061 family)